MWSGARRAAVELDGAKSDLAPFVGERREFDNLVSPESSRESDTAGAVAIILRNAFRRGRDQLFADLDRVRAIIGIID